MKKYLFSVVTIVFFLSANAQFKKGNMMMGGSLGFGNLKNTNLLVTPTTTGTYSSFSLYPSFEKFFRNNASWGIYAGFVNLRNKVPIASVGTLGVSDDFILGAMLKTYVIANKSVALFLQHSIQGKSSNWKYNPISTNKSTGEEIGYRVEPGVAYKLSPMFMLQGKLNNLLSLNYSHAKSLTDELQNITLNTGTSLTNLNVGLLVRIK